MNYPATIIIRHRREKLRKCSLRELEKRKDFFFLKYPLKQHFDASQTILLSFEGKCLSKEDDSYPLLILDGTWKYTKKMEEQILGAPLKRSLPKHIVTAYPRVQKDCSDPQRGLASIEAIFCAYFILERSVEGLLDGYYWKEKFIELNRSFLIP